MIAILGYSAGFESTFVPAIFPNIKEAKEWAKTNESGDPDLPWHFMAFDYGEVDFDYYDAEENS